jgi:hypothetical protein
LLGVLARLFVVAADVAADAPDVVAAIHLFFRQQDSNEGEGEGEGRRSEMKERRDGRGARWTRSEMDEERGG